MENTLKSCILLCKYNKYKFTVLLYFFTFQHMLVMNVSFRDM